MNRALGRAILLSLVLRRRPLLGYIDPSSGGMLFYVLTFILSALSGVVMIFSRQIRMFLARAKRFLRGKRGE